LQPLKPGPKIIGPAWLRKLGRRFPQMNADQ